MAFLDGRSQLPISLPWLGAAALLVCAAIAAQSEYSVKAAFLLNFTRFVQWPPAAFESAQSPLNICVLGDDRFDGVLDQLVEGEVVGGRRVAVQRIRKAPAAKSCQVLFVSGSEKDVRRTLAAAGHGVLTVGEHPDFLAAGGMIAFVLDDHRVRFDIHQSAASAAGLTISSRMLAVARSVQK
jgi:hypothetical protein